MLYDGKHCGCTLPAAHRCVRCGAHVCRWHVADAPFPDLVDVTAVVLRPVCLPGCGAPMTRNWVADCAAWAARRTHEGSAHETV